MGKLHTEDYKLSAVKYALKTGNQVDTCEVLIVKGHIYRTGLICIQKTDSPVRKTQNNRVACYPCFNPIKQYFNQVKYYINKESPIST